MKKFVSIILVMFYFLGVAYATPSEMSKEEWDNEVDYVICCYVRAYCDASSKDKDNREFKKYKDNIKPKLDSVYNEKREPIHYKGLSDLLKNNGWSTTDSIFASVIDQRRNTVNNDYVSLVKTSEFDDKYKRNLIAEQERLLKRYIQKIHKNLDETVKKLKNTEEELDSAKKEQKERKENTSTVNPFMILFFLVLAIFLYFYFGIYKRMKDGKEYYKSECEKSKDLKSENEKLKQDLNEKTREVAKLEDETTKLSKELYSARETIASTNSVKPGNPTTVVLNPSPTINEPQQPKKNINIKYFQFPDSNGEVKVLFDKESSNFYYKVHLESNTKGRFEFCGKSEKAINNSDSYLANACEYKDIPVNASRIITDEPGILVLQGNVWRVEKKSRIHFS